MLDKITVGDCRVLLREIESDSIDLIVFSPNYNKGNLSPPGNTTWTGKKDMKIEYENSSDNQDEMVYRTSQIGILNQCVRVVKPGGCVWYNHKPRRIDGVISLPSEWLREFNIWQVIYWDRGNTPQVNNFCFFPTVEWFVQITKTNSQPKFYRERAIFNTEVWRCPPVSNPLHPAPFTPKVVRNIILTCSDVGDVVLDPFCGIGTALIEAKRLGRHYMGIDISPQYASIAHNKLSNTVLDTKAIAKQDRLEVN